MNIYLMVKTHNTTGLKYLCKTKQKDPHKYKGSGDYWIPHIKKHGYDVTTEILKECSSNEEIKQWGLHYSELWNVVNARDDNGRKLWANLKPESGDGGFSLFGDSHPMRRAEVATKVGNALRGKKHSPERCAANAAGQRGKRYSEEDKKKRSNKLTGVNHPNYIATQYQFIHVSGLTETCTIYDLYTKYNLPKGNVYRMMWRERKSVLGWKLTCSHFSPEPRLRERNSPHTSSNLQ